MNVIPSRWTIRGGQLNLEERPLIMGILNLTPDSFSDGGQFSSPHAAVEHALEMLAEGADIIDIGGESTRPGAAPVSADNEIARILPVVEELRERTAAPLSIDTTKASVARRALQAGAHIINNVGALDLDPQVGEVVAEYGAGLVLMHMQGEPANMQLSPTYQHLLEEITASLSAAIERALKMGVQRSALMVDPGIGFGKTSSQSWEILANLNHFNQLQVPIMIGTSRKSFLRECVGKESQDLETATVATNLIASLCGARVLRVHMVRPSLNAALVVSRILNQNRQVFTGRS